MSRQVLRARPDRITSRREGTSEKFLCAAFAKRIQSKYELLRASVELFPGSRNFCNSSREYFYLCDFDSAHVSISPGTRVSAFAIEQAAQHGAKFFDFLQGDERHKYQPRFPIAFAILAKGLERSIAYRRGPLSGRTSQPMVPGLVVKTAAVLTRKRERIVSSFQGAVVSPSQGIDRVVALRTLLSGISGNLERRI